MRVAAVLTALIFLAACGGLYYLYSSAEVTVERISYQAIPASEDAQRFEELRHAFANGGASGIRFSDEVPESAEDWQFITYSLHIKNATFLNADALEIQITPMAGDVLELGDETIWTLPSRSEGDLRVTLLTSIHMHAIREMTLRWYMNGQLYSLITRVTGV